MTPADGVTGFDYVQPPEEPPTEPVEDGEGFDASLVPDGPLRDLFYDGRTGAGISNAEWDEQASRLRAAGENPFDHGDGSDAA